MSNNNSKSTKNQNQKHQTENRPGVTTQIRLYPVKKPDEISYAKISVIFDETKKGTDDNLIKVEVPFMDRLELEAEQWLSNVVFLETQSSEGRTG